jgi:ribose transport system substrate-binding protein
MGGSMNKRHIRSTEGVRQTRSGGRVTTHRITSRMSVTTLTVAAMALALTGIGAGVTSASAAGSGVAAAKAFVASHEAFATKIDITAPLTKRPPKGLKIAILMNQTSSLDTIEGTLAQAAKHFGWKVEEIQQPLSLTGAVSAMNSALETNPNAIVAAGNPASTYPTQIATMKKRGIAYIAIGTPGTPGNGVTAIIGEAADYTQRGVYLANWVDADSNGTGNSVVFNLEGYPILNDVATGYTSTMASLCSTCQVSVQESAATTIGSTLPSQIVNYLRANPSVTYVMLTYGDMGVGLQSALQQAGLTSVKVVVQTVPSDVDISNGTYAVNVGESDPVIGFLTADAIARYFVHDPLPQKQYSILQNNILVPANVGAHPSQNYVSVPGYQAQFLKLWGLG